MRNTKDIADAVFRIRDEYLEQKKKKHIRIEKACAAVSVMAAAVAITAGAAKFLSYNKPLNDSEIIPVTDTTTVLPTETVTTVNAASAHVSTYTTASSTKKTSTTASLATKSKTSMITSAVSHTVSAEKTTVSPAVAVKVTTADTNNTPITTTTDISEIDCEEVIRMKVDYVKKYLAALSAAAIASSGNPISANAESLFTPKALDPKVDSILYIEDNLDTFDFDGNGKADMVLWNDNGYIGTYMNCDGNDFRMIYLGGRIREIAK